MTKISKNKMSRRTLYLLISFTVLFLNYSTNIFKIASFDAFYNFDNFSEAFVMGKLARSKTYDIFIDGGLTGYNYAQDSVSHTSSVFITEYPKQLEYFIDDAPIPSDYITYDSQTGGQAIMYSALSKILPTDNRTHFRIFKLINAFLVALCFTIFIDWAYRNFGIISSAVLLLLMTISPWLVSFGHSLWWSLWSFYLPFIALLLLLEKRNNGKAISDLKIFTIVFIMVFAKCVFTGFEFISTALLMTICPIVYYYVMEQKPFKEFFVFATKIGCVAVAAVISEMVLLVVQIRALKGSFSAGFDHIISSYARRTEFNDMGDYKGLEEPSLTDILSKYLQGNTFNIGLNDINLHFGIIILIIIVLSIVLLLTKEYYKNKTKALIVTTAFSILCPLSWFIIFKQHAAVHTHLDYIVWYMPFLFLGYLVVGQSVSLLYIKTKK